IASRQATGVVRKGRVASQFGRAENIAQFDVLAGVTRGDNDVAVRDREHLIRHNVGVGVTYALRDVAGYQVVQRLVGQYADGGVHQGGIDIAALTGGLALVQRSKNADDRVDTSENVRHRNTNTGRLAVRHAGQVHDAAHALRHQVVARALGIGP